MTGGRGEFNFINGTGQQLLLVLEPESHEFCIALGTLLQIQTDSEECLPSFDMEFLARALVVYLPQGQSARVFQDGKELQPAPQSRRRWHALNG
ncbi:hypothetical protein [Pseudomonas pseudonitroreducens]|uniref:hypothetical protein n=1 Tax=Pseudomonas pseudonitroreducens TaxID=2892326 RepID=UPI001F29A809|nr:hypothetical protein [Pseudomonas pseudonitroreducens]